MKFSHVAIISVGLLAAFAAAVEAQVVVPTVVNVGASDLFQDVVGGYAQQGNVYATAAQINGVIGYANQGVLATGQSLTFGNSTQEIVAQSSGTIAALTLTASAGPGDGQLNCYFNIAATTAITWNANTGQTIANAPTAGSANTKYCMIYSKSLGGWQRAQ